MAAPNPDYNTSLLATTIELWAARKLADQVHQQTPFLRWLQKYQAPYSGGTKVLEQILYNTSTQSKFFDKGDTFSTAEEEIATIAEFPCKNYGIPLVIFDVDTMDNIGKQQMVDLVKAKMQWAAEEMAALLTTEFYQSAQTAKGIIPLPVMVDATSTVGDINSTTEAWWQANLTDGGSAALSTAIMETKYNQCMRYNSMQGPDGIFAGVTTYEGYKDLAGPLVRVNAGSLPTNLDLGFEGLAFRNTVIYYEPAQTDDDLYYLNSKALRWRPHTSCAKGYKSQVVRSQNQPAVVHLLWGRGTLTVNKRRALGASTSYAAP